MMDATPRSANESEAEKDMLHYIERLESSTCFEGINGCERLLRQFRLATPDKFVELCKVHLSFLLDIPTDFLVPSQDTLSVSNSCSSFGYSDHQHNKSLKKSLYFYFKRSKVRKLEKTVNAATVSTVINYLIARKDEFSEGIFRKTGNLVKQKLLVKHMTEDPSNLDLHHFSIHDLACTLKTLILRCPIISENISPLLLEVTKLELSTGGGTSSSNGSYNTITQRLVRAKQLKGYRILCLLLEPSYRHLLMDLLYLLRLVCETPATRMTPESLGTIFGPPLLLASSESPLALWNKCGAYGRTIRNLISWSNEVCKAPAVLVMDVQKNTVRSRHRFQSAAYLPMRSPSVGFLKLDRYKTSSKLQLEDEDALDMCVRFAVTTPAKDTPAELDKLMSVINDMPNKSVQKKKYIRRFTRLASSPQPYPEKSTIMSHTHLPSTPRLSKSGQSLRDMVTPKRPGMKTWNSLVASVGPIKKISNSFRQTERLNSCIFSSGSALEYPVTPL